MDLNLEQKNVQFLFSKTKKKTEPESEILQTGFVIFQKTGSFVFFGTLLQ